MNMKRQTSPVKQNEIHAWKLMLGNTCLEIHAWKLMPGNRCLEIDAWKYEGRNGITINMCRYLCRVYAMCVWYAVCVIVVDQTGEWLTPDRLSQRLIDGRRLDRRLS
jgi:hypothetical protein